MLYATIALFSLTAILGIVILKNWLTSQNTTRATIYAHGVFAALSLVLLIVYYFQNEAKTLQTSIILFLVAAIAGFYMFFRDLKGKMSPTWLAIVHGLVAVAAFVLVILMVI